jgi:hypothetical protein
MRNLNKFVLIVSSCLMLIICSAPSAQADTIENLIFTGTARCTDSSCSTFGSGPLTGTYTLDVETQTIVGSWSFSTPFGVISSGDAGAFASVMSRSGDNAPAFQETTASPPFYEFVFLFFPGSNLQEIGPLDTNGFSDACIPIAGSQGCLPDYKVTGSTTLAPEPSSVMLLGLGVLGLLGFALAKSLFSN